MNASASISEEKTAIYIYIYIASPLGIHSSCFKFTGSLLSIIPNQTLHSRLLSARLSDSNPQEPKSLIIRIVSYSSEATRNKQQSISSPQLCTGTQVTKLFNQHAYIFLVFTFATQYCYFFVNNILVQ